MADMKADARTASRPVAKRSEFVGIRARHRVTLRPNVPRTTRVRRSSLSRAPAAIFNNEATVAPRRDLPVRERTAPMSSKVGRRSG
jgi:hypothetical protein